MHAVSAIALALIVISRAYYLKCCLVIACHALSIVIRLHCCTDEAILTIRTLVLDLRERAKGNHIANIVACRQRKITLYSGKAVSVRNIVY